MGDDKPTNPKRRQFLEDFLINLGREAGKVVAELRKTSQELSQSTQPEPSGAPKTSQENAPDAEQEESTDLALAHFEQRLDEIDAKLTTFMGQMQELRERIEDQPALTQEDAVLLQQAHDCAQDQNEIPQHGGVKGEETNAKAERIAEKKKELRKLIIFIVTAATTGVIGNRVDDVVVSLLESLKRDVEAAPLPPTVELPQPLAKPQPPSKIETPSPPMRMAYLAENSLRAGAILSF